MTSPYDDRYRSDDSPAIRENDSTVLDNESEDEYTEDDYATAYSEVFGREITFLRPTDIEFGQYAEDYGSESLDILGKSGAAGDFFRDHLSPEDFREYRRIVARKARRNPARGAVILWEIADNIMNTFYDNRIATDESETQKYIDRKRREQSLKAKNEAAKHRS